MRFSSYTADYTTFPEHLDGDKKERNNPFPFALSFAGMLIKLTNHDFDKVFYDLNISTMFWLVSTIGYLGPEKAGTHYHGISDVIILSGNLVTKSNAGHTHTIANVTGLQTALDRKVNNSGGLIVNAFKTEAQDALDATFTPVKFDNVLSGDSLTADESISFTLPAGRYRVQACIGFGFVAADTTLQCLVPVFVENYEVAQLGRMYLTDQMAGIKQ